MIELGFSMADFFGFIGIGMMFGAGFFYPFAVAMVIKKGMTIH